MDRRRRWRTRWALALVAGVLAPFLVPEVVPSVEALAPCGAEDMPETGIRGDVPLADQISGRADSGYNCGLALVGYSSLGGRGGNANMAWSGDCAYIAGDGVAVVDAGDPANPQHVTTLHGPGSEDTLETLDAVDAPGRHLLATGLYGLIGFAGQTGTAPVDLWDVTDCAHPRLITTLQFPGNVHNLTFSADGKRLWSTLPLQAMDLTDLAHPVLLPNIESQLAASGHFKFQYAHEAVPSADDTRLYVGDQLDVMGESLLVIDTTDWPNQPARVIGSAPLPGHSINIATIGGKPFLLSSDESIANPTAKGCLPDLLTPFGGVARPALTDLSNEDLPRTRSELSLPINDLGHCVDEVVSMVNASVHYHDVDDPDDTTFAMTSMWNAGLRIWDVRDPYHPEEVAYFNPGRFAGSSINADPAELGLGTLLGLASANGLDQAWAHVRYREDTGHIWLTTASGGFWVLELEPQVRAALDLPARPAVHPNGAAPRPPATRVTIGAANASLMATYCVINSTLPL